MRIRTVIVLSVLLLGFAASASAQAVSLQFNNGRVTLNAQNASLTTILTEWSRLGGTKIVNGERIGREPVTLELTDMPERQALDILLRSVAGYMVTARQQPGGVSTLGGVHILATSSPPRTQAPVTFSATTVQQQRVEDRDQDDRAGVAAPVLPGPNVVRLPTSTAFGQPDQQQQPAPQPAPTRPASTIQTLPGTSRPGEITPVTPQQPQQPLPPPQPQRR